MRRPSAARKALGFSPLVQASRAYASRVEGIPLVAAGAEPLVFFAGRPAAQRATDARLGRALALLLFSLAIQNHGGVGRVIREGAHAPPLCPSSHPRVENCTTSLKSIDAVRDEV